MMACHGNLHPLKMLSRSRVSGRVVDREKTVHVGINNQKTGPSLQWALSPVDLVKKWTL